jgi:hypothetical protein
MLFLGLLGMYFDAVVVFVTSQTLLFRLALAILWHIKGQLISKCHFGVLNSSKNRTKTIRLEVP